MCKLIWQLSFIALISMNLNDHKSDKDSLTDFQNIDWIIAREVVAYLFYTAGIVYFKLNSHIYTNRLINGNQSA